VKTAALAAGLALLFATPSRAEPMRRLHGTVPPALAGAPAVRAPHDLRLEYVTIVLGLRDRATLDALVAAQQERRSPHYRRWLDVHEIRDRFGPRQADYERVRSWFVGRGLEVVYDSPQRVAFAVAGTAAQVEAALAAPIGLFRRDGQVYRGPLADPELPESVAASVRGIFGLDDLPRYRPLARLMNGDTVLAPEDFASVYRVEPLRAAGLTGAGRSIAVVARSDFLDTDIATFSARFLPGNPLTPRRVFVGPNLGRHPDQLERIEVLLDTQWAGALAPGAQLNVIIGTRGQFDIPGALAAAVDQRLGDVITISFGLCERASPPGAAEWFDAQYAIANLQGQTVLVASGDAGADDCAPELDGLSVNALASSPHAVAVGGSSFALDTDGSPPSLVVESVWNDAGGAGGGGRSEVFGLPRYQRAAGLGALSSGRVLPDLALAASPTTPGYVVVEGGNEHIVGGTSASAPALASVLTLLNEDFTNREGTPGLGQFLPLLHRLGSEGIRGLRPPVFRDITAGNNRVGQSGFDAGPGFDLASGWGAPLGDALAAALQRPGRCEPEIDCLVPARGSRRRACAAQWLIEQRAFATNRRGQPRPKQSCRDGDPQCDTDGAADGQCTMNVALCLNVYDHRDLVRRGLRRGLPRCEPGQVRAVRLLTPRVRDPNREALLAALASLPSLPTALVSACSATVPVQVQVGKLTVRARVKRARRWTVSRVTLHCLAS
jgi:hypothetical protein